MEAILLEFLMKFERVFVIKSIFVNIICQGCIQVFFGCQPLSSHFFDKQYGYDSKKLLKKIVPPSLQKISDMTLMICLGCDQ